MPITGAGNPAGSGGTAGVGTSLNYVGDYAFGFSGIISAASSSAADTTLLDFTMGSHFLVGTIAFQTTEIANNAIYLQVLVNGEAIITGAWDNSGNGQATANTPIDLILPAYCRVQVRWGITGGTGADATAQITGRVYR